MVKNQKWSVSCTYDFESDFKKGTYHGLDYDMEFTGGEFLHLALVPNPRYERATIVMNSQDDTETIFLSGLKTIIENALNNGLSDEDRTILNGLSEIFNGKDFNEADVNRDELGRFAEKEGNNLNYSSYEDYEKEFMPYIEEAPEDYKIYDFAKALKDLNISEKNPLQITNPYETVNIAEESVWHIVTGDGDGHEPDVTRFKSINKMLATVKDPNLITEDENGKKAYYKLFKDNNEIKRQFVILFDKNNMPEVYTTMPVNKDKKYFINQINRGEIKYKKGQTRVKE